MLKKIDRIRHSVDIIVDGIWKRQNRALRQGDSVSRDDLIAHIRATQLEMDKIRQVVDGRKNQPILGDVAGFISRYVHARTIIPGTSLNLAVAVRNYDDLVFENRFRESDIAVMVDNILINAARAGATSVTIQVTTEGLQFTDNGRGIPDGIAPRNTL